MNVFSFTGAIGQDCETKYTQNGTAICEFSVAVTSGYGDKQKTTWAKCALIGKRAEGQLPQYLVKGQKVAISGELTLDQWENNGQKYSALKVVVGSLDLIGEKKAQDGYVPPSVPQNQASRNAPAPDRMQNQSPIGGFDNDFDSQIPF